MKMSVIKCEQCGLQMGDGAFDNCPACNAPVTKPAAAAEPPAETPAENDNGSEDITETNPATEPA